MARSLEVPFQFFFSVQEAGGSPKGPDPEKWVGYEDIGSTNGAVSSWLQVPDEPFPSWSD